MTAVTETAAPSTIDEAIADFEDQLAMLFSRVRSVYKDAAAQIHPDLKPVGYKILSSIVRLGETNAGALADALDTDKSVVSRQVRMLEEAGLVVSRADDRDGRSRILSATPEAVEQVRAVRSGQRNALRDLLRRQSEEDVRAFAALLRLINED